MILTDSEKQSILKLHLQEGGVKKELYKTLKLAKDREFYEGTEENPYSLMLAQLREMGLRSADLKDLRQEAEESDQLTPEHKKDILAKIDSKIAETGV